MNDQQFEALVSRLNQQAMAAPSLYRTRVLLLAMLGNAYIGLTLVLTVVLIGVLLVSIAVLKALAIKLMIPLLLFLWMLAKALWVKLPTPQGIEIRRKEAPELFAMVDGLRRQLKAPRFHHILITDELNAGVSQRPRLGIFGWPTNYLIIGLPLMSALSVEQFKAVLAHELGHLARGHGKTSSWIYRQRIRWVNLLEAIDKNQGAGNFVIKPFMNWFVPYFNAYTFPMARANEYEADRTSAQLTSPKTAAAALTNVEIISSYLSQEYWPQIHKQAEDLPQPNFSPFSGMGHIAVSQVDKAAVGNWLNEAMARQTNSFDTHPALSDRLKALDEPPLLTTPDGDERAHRLLGKALQTLTEQLDHSWRSRVTTAWASRFQTVQEQRQQLAELNGRATAGETLSPQEAYDRANLTGSVGNDPDEALRQIQALHEQLPDDAVVCLSLGEKLLARDDEHGCHHVERAMALDDSTTAEGCALLRDFFGRAGNMAEAQAWHERLVARLEMEAFSATERNQVLMSDQFTHHQLDDADLANLREALRSVDGLHHAYLVTKQVKHFAQRPCYVLGYTSNKWYQLHSDQRARKVMQQIKENIRFPGETLIISLDGDNRSFAKKFKKVSGCRIL